VNDHSRTRGAAPKPAAALLKPAIALLALALLLILPSAALAAGGWHAQTSGTPQDLGGVGASSGGRLWVVGAGGTILTSLNDGATWAAQSSGTTQNLRAVAFADTTHGWAVGDGGTIVTTGDAGATWAAQTSGTTQNLRAVAFADATHGWAVGDGGTILGTVDGGATWMAQGSGTTLALYGVACSGASTAWAVGAGGTVVATSDGTTWTAQSSGTTRDLRGVAFADATHGWAVGSGGTIVTTSTGGAAWAAQASHSTRDLSAVAFADATHGWAIGSAGTILFTANGGAAWTAQSSTTAKDLFALAFTDVHHGFVAGAGGTILTTGDGGIVDTIAPHTTAKGLQAKDSAGWRHTSQTVTLQASDSGSGPAATYYTIDGGARQTYSAPFVVTAAGPHAVTYWSLDWAGNAEAKHTGYVNLDLAQPTCLAQGNVKTFSGTTATFSFRVNDPKPTCGFGDVSITIYKNGKAKKRFKLSRVTLNTAHAKGYRLTLPAGEYTWTVTATDIAGNAQVKAGTAQLKILAMPLPTIADVQRRLVALRYLPSSAVTGKSDYRTSQAVMAFQAWNGLPRDGVAGVQTRTKLLSASVPHPRAGSYGHHVEVYRSLGVVLCVDGGTVVRVVHCSTGRPGLETTAGVWHVYLKSLRFYSREYDSWMPWTSFFHGGEGLHGYEEVPSYPASHGCVRLSMPEAPWVYDFATMGTTVIVY